MEEIDINDIEVDAIGTNVITVKQIRKLTETLPEPYIIKRRSRVSGWYMMIKSIKYWIKLSKIESYIIEERIHGTLVV